MKSGREVSPGREDSLRAAADWMLRISDSRFSRSEFVEFEAWCEASPDNRRAFEEMQTLWAATGAVQEAEIDSASIEADRYLGQVSIEAWRRARKRRSPVESLRALRVNRRVLASASAFVVVAALAIVLLASKGHFDESQHPPDLSIVTEAGMNRDVVLPDGSNVTVAGGSRLSARFTEQARTLVLERGEAFFRIAPDKNRPFTVNAMDTRVTAIGTAFNVRAERDVVRVAVTEGAVSVDRERPLAEKSQPQSREVIRLAAGHQVTLSRFQPDPIVVSVDIENATAWLSGTLKFVDEPLSSVVSAINRHAVTPVSIGDRAVEDYRFTGTVVPDRVDEWLRGLPDIFPVEIVERPHGGEAVIRLAPHGSLDHDDPKR